jgi:hypothetical protein
MMTVEILKWKQMEVYWISFRWTDMERIPKRQKRKSSFHFFEHVHGKTGFSSNWTEYSMGLSDSVETIH